MRITKTIRLLPGLIFLIFLFQCSAQPANTEHDINEIEILVLQKENLYEALERSNAIISAAPDNMMAYAYRAWIYSELGKEDDFEKDCNHAMKLAERELGKNPENSIALYVKGAIYYFKGEKEKSMDYLTKSIDSGATPTNAYRLRASLYDDLGKYEQTISDLSYIIEADFNQYPNIHAMIYYIRGEVFLKIDEKDKAKSDFSKAISLKPDFADAYIARSMIYLHNFEYDESLKDLEKGLKLNPDQMEGSAYIVKGTIALEVEKDSSEAVKYFTRAIEIMPDSAESYYRRGKALLHSDDHDAARSAIHDFEMAITLDPEHADAHASYGVVLLAQKDFEEAIKAFNIALELDPDNDVATRFKKLAEEYMASDKSE